MKAVLRSITPTNVLAVTRHLLVTPGQPYLIPPHHRVAFSEAWEQYRGWSESSIGERTLRRYTEIQEEAVAHESAVDRSVTSSTNLVRTLLRLDCLDDQILNVRDTPLEEQRRFAAYAFAFDQRRGERGWCRYADLIGSLPALRTEYGRRLERTPLGRAILGALYGDPRRLGAHFNQILEIVRRSIYPREASVHDDSQVRKNETGSLLTELLWGELNALSAVPWSGWMPAFLDRRDGIIPRSKNRVIDRFRASKRRARGKVDLARFDESNEPDRWVEVPEELQVEADFDSPPEVRKTMALMRPQIATRIGEGNAQVIDVLLDEEVTGKPSQRAIAKLIGRSPRTVSSRLRELRTSEWFRQLLIDGC